MSTTGSTTSDSEPNPAAPGKAAGDAAGAAPGAAGRTATAPDRTPGTPDRPDALELERICAIGWPGLTEHRIGSWLLRFGEGFTGRANSVLVLGDPGMPFDDAVAAANEWYAGHGARPRFQIPVGTLVPPEVSGVAEMLTERGWTEGDHTAVLTADIDRVLRRCTAPPDPGVDIAPAPDAEWLATYVYRGKPLPASAVRVLRGGPDPVFVTVRRDSRVVAVARGVVTEGWLGVTAVTVVESARRSGLGTAVMAATLRWGQERGAHSAYLQVDHQNAAALAMYDRLGFDDHHGYLYRLPR